MSQRALFFGVTGVATVALIVAMAYKFSQIRGKTEDRAQAANLIVYTHSSFMDAYGPGADLKSEFEKSCVCTIDYVDAGGAVEVIERLKLDPSRRVDVVMGLDFLLLKRAAQFIRFQKLDRPGVELAPEVKSRVFERFIPYEWSPMGYIYREGEVPVVNGLSQALEKWPDQAMALQDPTLSAPGWVWLYSVYESAGPQRLEATLQSLKNKVHSYSPSWSSAYGLFKRQQAPVAFSYLTSLLYHWQVEKDRHYQFMSFDNGHPLQINYAAVPDNCWNCSVAKKFVHFLTTEWAQAKIAEKNFMLPVNARTQLPEYFRDLPKVKTLPMDDVEQFVDSSESLLQKWRANR